MNIWLNMSEEAVARVSEACRLWGPPPPYSNPASTSGVSVSTGIMMGAGAPGVMGAAVAVLSRAVAGAAMKSTSSLLGCGKKSVVSEPERA